MATLVLPTAQSYDEQDKEESPVHSPTTQAQGTRPVLSTNVSAATNASSNAKGPPSAYDSKSVNALLNSHPAGIDRGLTSSALGRYDSKRSSIVSSASFQTAPLVPGTPFTGGSGGGAFGGSVYGTADGGSSRETLSTVQGYDRPPSSTSPTYPHYSNGSANPSDTNLPKARDFGSSDYLSHPEQPSPRTTHPGNDLPSHLLHAPSPLDARPGTASSTSSKGRSMTIDTSVLSKPIKGVAAASNVLAETENLSQSPPQSLANSPLNNNGSSAQVINELHARMDATGGIENIREASEPEEMPANLANLEKDTKAEDSEESTIRAKNLASVVAGVMGGSKGRASLGQAQPAGTAGTATGYLHPSSALQPPLSIHSIASEGTTGVNPSAALSASAVAPSSTTPPLPIINKPTRRNTTGSTNMMSKAKASTANPVSALVGAGSATVGEGWDLDLDEDMRKQAEQIRRERKRRDAEAAEVERIRDERAEKRDSKGKERGRSDKTTKDKLYTHSRTGSAGGKSTRSLGAKSSGAKSFDDWKPVVGNVVGEGHVNYILMYNMLTGIRVAVSRCQAKPPRPLTDADYTAAHKYNFDVIGNEQTPGAKYDFKFKDYAPWVFRYLREESFAIDPADYLLSLTSKYILSELGSPGKSGSFFYFSRDYRFIIKTIRDEEHKRLRGMLKDYHQHVRDNPHTLISRFYGLHRVKLPHGRKIHFVIMNNLFPAHRDIHETYDLKGSTVGRLLPESKLESNPNAVMKDLNWIQRERVLELGPYKRALLTEQLRRDMEFLKSQGVMDYSLLVGLHSVKRGNKENIRGTTLKVFKPDIKDIPDVDASVGARKWIGIKHAMEVRRAIMAAQRQHHQGTVGSTNSTGMDATPIDRRVPSSSKEKSTKEMRTSKQSPLHTLESSNLPDEDPLPSDRSGFIFYSDDGGYRATDEKDQEWRGGLGGKAVVDGKLVSEGEVKEAETGDGEGVIYYIGVIDILTRYTFIKKVEHFWKGLHADRHKISPVKPPEYGDRFFSFMQAVMRGGEGGKSFV